MKRQGEKPIGSLLAQVLATNPSLREGYCKQKIKSSWGEISGEYVANATEEIKFEGRKMIVKLKSSIIRSEIMMIRSQLAYRINQFVGVNCIDEIIVR